MRELPDGSFIPGTIENALEHKGQKLVLQLAHNAGELGFKRKDVFESLQHVLPSSYTHDEKLRKIGNLLRKMDKDGFIIKASNGKQWNITSEGELELSQNDRFSRFCGRKRS